MFTYSCLSTRKWNQLLFSTANPEFIKECCSLKFNQKNISKACPTETLLHRLENPADWSLPPLVTPGQRSWCCSDAVSQLHPMNAITSSAAREQWVNEEQQGLHSLGASTLVWPRAVEEQTGQGTELWRGGIQLLPWVLVRKIEVVIVPGGETSLRKSSMDWWHRWEAPQPRGTQEQGAKAGKGTKGVSQAGVQWVEGKRNPG